MTATAEFTNGRAVTNAVDNASLARHRWYPIKEGFSAKLVADSYLEWGTDSKKQVLAIEPFSGSGTTPVECTRLGVACLAFEVNPFLAFIGRTKLRQADPKKLRAYRQTVLKGLGRPTKSRLEHISTFCEKRGRDKWLFNRDVLRTFAGGWEKIGDCPPTLRAFYRLALLRAAMDNCNAYPDGKCLRYKRLENFDCFNAGSVVAQFEHYCNLIEDDLESTPFDSRLSNVECIDSRELSTCVPKQHFDLCVTSPPYLNSFDYSDVYRPEMFLAGFVADNNQLMRIRLRTIRSHVQANWKLPVKTGFGTVYAKVLKEILLRKDRLWSARIPQMIQAYFEDMEELLAALSERANPNALLKIAVATSAYAGVVVPVDFILAEIAEQAGWELQDVQVVRRLRSSAQLWKHENRDKKVPELRESVVILRFPSGSRPVSNIPR
jgi:DNA modification methylase